MISWKSSLQGGNNLHFSKSKSQFSFLLSPDISAVTQQWINTSNCRHCLHLVWRTLLSFNFFLLHRLLLFSLLAGSSSFLWPLSDHVHLDSGHRPLLISCSPMALVTIHILITSHFILVGLTSFLNSRFIFRYFQLPIPHLQLDD